MKRALFFVGVISVFCLQLSAQVTFKSKATIKSKVTATAQVASAADNFNRADSGALGSNWTQTTGQFGITSNTATGSTSFGYELAYWNAATFNDNQFAQMTLGSRVGGTYKGAGVRLQTGSASGYYCWSDGGNNHVQLQRIDSGSATNLGDGAAAANNGDVIKIVANGSSISCYLNGSLYIGPFTDTTYTSGRVGLAGYNNGTTSADDWSGGNN